MFKAGDKVKIDLEKLWKISTSKIGDLPSLRRITSEGMRVYGAFSSLYHADGSCVARNGDVLLVKGVDDDILFLENNIVLSLTEAKLCLEKVPEKKFSFEDLFEELSDSVTMDDVKSGKLLFQKNKSIDGENIDVAIYSYQDKNWLIAYKDYECITFREYTGEVPQKTKTAEAEPPTKRVVQISVDVEIDAGENGDNLAEKIAEDLENAGHVVLGSAFQADMSLEYDYEVER